MTRRRRRLLVLLATAVALVVVLGVGRWWAIDYVKREVDTRLTALNGGPVTVAQHTVRLALSGVQITLRDVDFRQRSPDRPAWLTAETIGISLTAADLFAGRTVPREIDIHGLRVQIDLDRDGQLVTDLPTSGGGLQLPADRMVIDPARFELRQQGRDSLVADRVALSVVQPGESLAVSGTIGQLLGGTWSLDLKLDGRTLATSARLASAAVEIDSGAIARLPLAPPALRETLHLDGITAVSVDVKRPPKGEFEYQIALTPKALAIDWPQIDLALRDVTGSLVVDNGRVTLTRMRASMAGARVELNGQIDFRTATTNGQLGAEVEGLSLAALPPKWAIPKGLSGTASSKFDLSWEASSTGVRVRGGGQGTLDNARLAGLDSRPIHVRWQLGDSPPGADGEIRSADSAELTVDVATEGARLTTLLNAAQIDPQSLGVDGRERITAAGQLRIPLATATDLQTYRGALQLSLVQGADPRRRVRNAAADVTWEAGGRIVTHLDVDLTDAGHIHAEAATEPGRNGQARGQIVFDQIPLAVAGRWLGLPADTVGGSWSARGDWSVLLRRWRDIAAWQGHGELAVTNAKVGDESISDMAANIAIEKGQLSATDVRGVWQGNSIEAHGTLDLQTPYRFDVQLSSTAVQLKHILAIARPTWPRTDVGTATIGGHISGTLRPRTWQASGQGDIAELVIAQLPVGGPRFHWSVDADHWSLTDVKARVAEGTVELNLTVPWDETSAGKLVGRFDGVQVRHIAARLEPLPVTITGPAAGDFSISDLFGSALTADVRFRAGAAVMRDIAVERIEGQAAYREGKVQIEVRGKALDGDVQLKGTVTRWPTGEVGPDQDSAQGGMPLRILGVGFRCTWPFAPRTSAFSRSKKPRTCQPCSKRLSDLASGFRFDGELRLHRGRLQRLSDLLRGQPWLRPLAGDIDIQLDLQVGGTARPGVATGWVELRDVRWDGTQLLQQVKGRIELAEGRLRLFDVETRLVDGRASAELSFAPAAGNEGSFAVRLERVRARRLLAPWPKLARRVQGSFDFRLEGKLGRRWSGTGQVQMRGGQIVGVPMQGSRVPFRWDFVPERASGHLVVRDAVVRPAHGQVTVDMRLDWGNRLSVDGTARVRAVDMRDLTGGLPNVQQTVTGLIDGELTLAGRNVRSLDDLTGTFKASLGQAHILSLPVFDRMVDALIIGQVLSPGFETSRVEGRLARGMISIKRMTLVGSGLQLLIEGDVTTAGRLDLNVTADIGQFSPHAIACRLLVNPAGLLRRRLVFLHVSGTVRTPAVHIRPLEQLDQEIRIFFLL